MAKIYTRTGDDGSTGLIGGARVSKSDRRIECYGTVDELSAAIGLAAVVASEELSERLRRVQSDLFVIGSHLASPQLRNAPQSLPPIEQAMIYGFEREIDAAESQLAPLRNFILSGGSELAARLHVGRTVCRRAERLVVALSQADQVPQLILKYLNRLSDWLFVQARLANKVQGVDDVPWKP
jgi:cob(I)alamin adenosyltransferase